MSEMEAGAGLLEDWLTIWHSELAAMVVDREMQEGLQALIDGWARQMQALVDAAHGPARAAAPPRAPAAAAASDGRDEIIRGLLERVAELERRLGAV